MDFDDYQKLSRITVIYPNLGDNFIYPTLGLTGEAGTVAKENIKKLSSRVKRNELFGSGDNR